MKKKRPFRVTICLFGVLTLGIASAWQAAVLVRQLGLMAMFNTVVSPQIRLGLALVWTVTWLALFIALWRRRPFVRRAIPAAVFLYTMVQLWLTWVSTPAVVRAGWPLTAGLGMVATAYCAWALRRV